MPWSGNMSFTRGVVSVQEMSRDGPAHVAGTTKVAGTPNFPVSRRVDLIDATSKFVVRSQFSDSAGNYRFDHVRADRKYNVIAYDYQHIYRAVIADNLTPSQ